MNEINIIEHAFNAAKSASFKKMFEAQWDKESNGVSYVNVSPAKSKLAKILLTKYDATRSKLGGVDISNPGGFTTKNIPIKEAGSVAFVKVLAIAFPKLHIVSIIERD